jgi:hypothetical protein
MDMLCFYCRKDKDDMAYQVTRSKRITETLELTDEKGNVVESINVNLDADAVCTAFRKKQTEVIDAERRLKEIRKNGGETDLECAYEAYGNAVIAIFELIFGEEGTKKLLEFFEDNYIEMGIQVVPFINAVIVPKINETLRNRKAQIRALHKYR